MLTSLHGIIVEDIKMIYQTHGPRPSNACMSNLELTLAEFMNDLQTKIAH